MNWWPLFDLRLVSDPLVLRPPRDDDIPGILNAIAAGIHPVGEMPFSNPWTEEKSPERERNAAKWFWKQRATWTPGDWTLGLAVFRNGTPIGMQDLGAKNFNVLRKVSSGSWLTQSEQGHGYGKLMRQMMLHFAFEGLGADVAESEAWTENAASIGVSRSVGYVDNGVDRRSPKGQLVESIRFRITREGWNATTRPEVKILGLEACREMFG